MFTTCFFCSGDLGRNEVLETMPVGRRVAFAERTGRLWVVCRACERWNLSPLEERWEAIEMCERLFRGARLRVSTDNVGLARLREGLDLIRIGEPMRPEFASWRYGDQFGRRRRRQLASSGAMVGALGVVVVGGAWAGVSVASFAGVYANSELWDRLLHGKPTKLVARVRGPGGEMLEVQRQHARMSALLSPEEPRAPFALRLEHKEGVVVLRGAEAVRAAQQVLPTVNRFGGSRKVVDLAVRTVEDAGGPEAVLSVLAREHGAFGLSTNHARTKKGGYTHKGLDKLPGVLCTLKPMHRLALEMALHEESERRAMDGELAALEAAWRDAEQIAKIADGMFQPPAVSAKLDAMRVESGRTDGGPAESGPAADGRAGEGSA